MIVRPPYRCLRKMIVRPSVPRHQFIVRKDICKHYYSRSAKPYLFSMVSFVITYLGSRIRSVFKISNLFLRPRPWQFEIWDSTDKYATYLLLGFETLNLKFCDLKLWKLTVISFYASPCPAVGRQSLQSSPWFGAPKADIPMSIIFWRNTILYYTIPYHTIPYHTILYYTTPYYERWCWWTRRTTWSGRRRSTRIVIIMLLWLLLSFSLLLILILIYILLLLLVLVFLLYIYIYIEREICNLSLSLYIYIYINTERERERELCMHISLSLSY